MIETQERDRQGNAYVGYGVEAWSGSTRLHRVEDLFTCRERCVAFVRMCNEEQVASFHLPEVIDNLLAE